MKLNVTQENLHQGLNTVARIANRNSNLPILSNVLLRADKNGLTLTTTDLEIGIKTFVRGKVEIDGEFTVGAKLFSDFVGLLPKENITLEVKDGSLRITSENQQTSIKGLPAEDFPLIPEIDKQAEVEIATVDFRRGLSQTFFAASLDSGRPEINAVNFLFNGTALVLAATDSYRLAEKQLSVVGEQTKDLIVPLRVIQELSRILSDNNGKTTTICFNENQIMFQTDGVELTSRVVDGKYPDYQQIIPEKFSTTASINIGKLVPAVKSASLFCKQGINDVRLQLVPDRKVVTVSAASSQTGESLATVPAEISGQAADVIFNYRYLLDGLANLESTEALLKLNEATTPGLLQPQGDSSYQYVIMPIRQ